VAALDDYGARSHLDDLARGGFHVGYIFDGQPIENFRFGNVRCDDAGTLQEFGGDVLDSGGVEEFPHRWRTHYGVMKDVGKFVGIEEFSDHDGIAAIAEHSDFHRGDYRNPFRVRRVARAVRRSAYCEQIQRPGCLCTVREVIAATP